jgi:hypothetical protein
MVHRECARDLERCPSPGCTGRIPMGSDGSASDADDGRRRDSFRQLTNIIIALIVIAGLACFGFFAYSVWQIKKELETPGAH